MVNENESSLVLHTELIEHQTITPTSPALRRRTGKSLPSGDLTAALVEGDALADGGLVVAKSRLNMRRRTVSKKENIDMAKVGDASPKPQLTCVNGGGGDASAGKEIKLEPLSVNNLEGKRRKSMPSHDTSTPHSSVKSEPEPANTDKPLAKPKPPTTSDTPGTNSSADSDTGSSHSDSEPDELEIEDEAKILEELELEYTKLTKVNLSSLRRSTCSVCEQVEASLECRTCKKLFHKECLGDVDSTLQQFKCQECTTNVHKCVVCHESDGGKGQPKKCASALKCSRYFHDECVQDSPLFRKDSTSSISAKVSCYTCPGHACLTCVHLERAGFIEEKQTRGECASCLRCPKTFHVGDFCIPAGSMVLDSCTIICADHFEPLPKVLIHNKVNVNWCFACCSPGELLNCSTCPSAYHRACTPNKSPEHDKQAEETWRCGECLAGKRPLNGDIVWAKVGMYRWWPAQICLQRFLPDKVKNKSGQVGEFPVKFFGTNDFYWVNLGRCFVFADGDEFQRNISAGKSLGVAYTNGVIDAIVAFRELKRLKTKHYTVTKTSVQKRQEYIPIRQCKPVGNVRVVRVPLSEQPHCDCAKSEANPCALASSCVNVALKYECHPSLCAGGTRCANQRFVRRQYPKQEVIKTSDGRGCGLWALEDIKKGQFVNEYVGELIDDEECKRRIKWANDNDINDFYLMTIEKDRVIDAGPKGNLARFMNHSCEPNCETQRWLVNGDVRIGLFAVKNIPARTELTFNYNLDCLSNEKAVCRCGSQNCSGYLGARPVKAGGDVKNGKLEMTEATSNGKKRKQTSRNSLDTDFRQMLPNAKKIKSQKARASTIAVPLLLGLDESTGKSKRKSKC